MKKARKQIFAIIHVGSELLSMEIVEYVDMDNYRIVDEVNRRVKLGEATFKDKKIPFSFVAEICEILKGFKRLMSEYGVEEYSAQATTAVREAENQAYFLDQIKIKTGLVVQVIDMPREIFIKFTSIWRTVTGMKKINNKKGILFVDISSGGLGITYMSEGIIRYQQNLHIGIIRVKETFDHNQRSSSKFGTTLTEYISSTIDPVRKALAAEEVEYLVIAGTETELILKMLGRSTVVGVPERLSSRDFMQFYEHLRKLNLNQIIKVYGLEERMAEFIWPTIILYQQLLSLVTAKEIIVTQNRFVDGMRTLYIANKLQDPYLQQLNQLLCGMQDSIGERFGYDQKHVEQVESIAMTIFDALKNSQGLTEHHRFLLRAACVLHDIGKYISLRSHVKYSYEMIMDIDMFGVSNFDKRLIALVSYYHAHLLFERQTEGAPQVPKNSIPLVAKLSAILCIADAMDRSYKQKIKACSVNVQDNELHIKVESKEGLELEQWSFKKKANFIEEVYGMIPILEKVGR